MKSPILLLTALLFAAPLAHAGAACPRLADDGDTCKHAAAPGFVVYDAAEKRWLHPDRFLANRLKRNGPNTWPTSREFPEYDQVKELDTFTALTSKGPCDMVFFHERWRLQANVWVWGEEMQSYQGCAVIFEE